jgi:hypothetical protein
MHPTVKAARIAGGIYLAEILIGPISLIYVPNVIIVSGNATATADNIRAHETLFRLGIVGDLVGGTLALFLVLALYRLFRTVDQDLAALMVILGGLMVTPIFYINALNWIAALILAHGTDMAGAFGKAQQDALAMLFMHLHYQGNLVNSIFWGLWLFPFGALVIKSGFLPRFLGAWLLAGGLAYIATSSTGLLWPQHYDTVFFFAQPALFGEIAIMLWLLIKGADVRKTPAPAA